MKRAALVGAFCVAAMLALALVLAWRSSDQRRIDQLAHSTNQALCALKLNHQRSYDNTLAFLKAHPEGVAGISRADIERSLAAHRETLTALRDLDC